MKTKSEIQAEIEALNSLKPVGLYKIRTQWKIELAVEELESGVDFEISRWGQLSTSEQDIVMDARRWKNGEIDERPSRGWGDLVE